MSTAALSAVVLAHLVLPWLIRALACRTGGLVVEVLRRPVLAYGRATAVLGALAVTLFLTTGWSPFRHTPLFGEFPVLEHCLAACLGAGGPLLAMRTRGRRLKPFARRLPASDLLVLALAGVAEELLWRAVAFGLLVQAGVAPLVAAAVAVAGFTLLHLPSTGWRRLPYLAVLAAVLALLAVTAGLAAAIVCHITHNVVVLTAATARPRGKPKATRPAVPAVPPARAWDG